MIKGRLKKINNKEMLLLVGASLVFVFLMLFNLVLKDSHAFYSYDSGWTPIFTGKVGDFSGGKLDLSPYEGEGDINIIVYQSDGAAYHIIDKIPVAGIVLNQKKSTCTPDTATYSDYSIDREGLLKLKVKEGIPNQITCRIVYDLTSDVIVYAYMEDASGTEKYGTKTYTLVDTIPTNYTYVGYRCTKEDIQTDLGYDATTGFHFKTEGPNTCYAYFNK